MVTNTRNSRQIAFAFYVRHLSYIPVPCMNHQDPIQVIPKHSQEYVLNTAICGQTSRPQEK